MWVHMEVCPTQGLQLDKRDIKLKFKKTRVHKKILGINFTKPTIVYYYIV